MLEVTGIVYETSQYARKLAERFNQEKITSNASSQAQEKRTKSKKCRS